MFNTAQVMYMQRLLKERPGARRGGRTSLPLSSDYGVGVVVGAHIFYRPEHFELVHRLLVNHGLPTEALPATATRADVAQYGGLSEKTFSASPHSDSIAVKLIGGCTVAGKVCDTPDGTYLVMTLKQALSVECDRIMVVENLEPFRELHEYSWIDYQGQRVLVVYRGDTRLDVGLAQQLVEQRNEPVWAFVDFDPAGMVIAKTVGAGRMERQVLPSDEWLRKAADTHRGRELYAQQGGCREEGEGRGPAYALLSSLESGVVQEQMKRALPTVLSFTPKVEN